MSSVLISTVSGAEFHFVPKRDEPGHAIVPFVSDVMFSIPQFPQMLVTSGRVLELVLVVVLV